MPYRHGVDGYLSIHPPGFDVAVLHLHNCLFLGLLPQSAEIVRLCSLPVDEMLTVTSLQPFQYRLVVMVGFDRCLYRLCAQVRMKIPILILL